MTDDKKSSTISVSIGGNASENIIVAGEHNQTTVTSQHLALPLAENVNITKELAALREILHTLKSPDQRKIDNAFSDAEDELKKDKPDKDEVGKALERALSYSKKMDTFGKIINTVKPHVLSASSWLGEGWHNLIEWME